MITRRGLLAAGAGAVLLGGCGDDEPSVAPDAELLGSVLAVERALLQAYSRVPGRLGRELGARAGRFEGRLIAAGAHGSAEEVAVPGGAPLEAALALERRAMRASVTAVGVLREPARRTLAAEVLTGAAQHAAVLLERLGRDPLVTAFPDGRET